MGIFRRKSAPPNPPPPLPDWDDTRWRSHLRANALGTDHHCGLYVDMIANDRKEAARLYRNEEHSRARALAESAIRNNRIVTSLAALSPLCNALYQRSEPLAGYTSLVQVPEPARSGIVTIVFAASRLQMPFLADTVKFLSEQFGSVHINQIQKAQGELYPLVNATVRDALSAVPATKAEVDAELTACVKQHFGITIQPSPTQTSPSAELRQSSTHGTPPEEMRNSPIPPGLRSSPNPVGAPVRRSPVGQPGELRRSQTTPVSAHSEEINVPLSPQLSQEKRMFAGMSTPPRYPQKGTEGVRMGGVAVREMRDEVPPTRLMRREERPVPEHRRAFVDSDEMLLARFEHLRAVISA